MIKHKVRKQRFRSVNHILRIYPRMSTRIKFKKLHKQFMKDLDVAYEEETHNFALKEEVPQIEPRQQPSFGVIDELFDKL